MQLLRTQMIKTSNALLDMGGGGGDCCPIFTPYYLIWDADCIALNDMMFFHHEKLQQEKPENLTTYFAKHDYIHKPYFDTLERLQIPIYKQDSISILMRAVDFSFIVEHMMINNSIMCELISRIEKTHNKLFFEAILESIDECQLSASGFSEFETYGNFVASQYGNQALYITLRQDRAAKSIISINPTHKQLEWYSKYYDTCCIETWIEESFIGKLTKYAVFRSISPYTWHKILSAKREPNIFRKKLKAKLKNLVCKK